MQNHDAPAHEYIPGDEFERAHMRWCFPVACQARNESSRRFFSDRHDNEHGASSCTCCEFMQNHATPAHEYMPGIIHEQAHMRWCFPVACKGQNEPSPPSCSDIHDNKQGTSSCTFFEFVKNYDSHSARFVLELLEGSMILYVAHCCPQGEVCRVRICAEVLVFVVDHVLAPQIAQAFIQ